MSLDPMPHGSAPGFTSATSTKFVALIGTWSSELCRRYQNPSYT